MEDNSYVSLSLEKYNELYDKAKTFDELTEKFADNISETITTILDNVNSMFATDEEHSGETEEHTDDTVYNVECVEGYRPIPVGAKGIDLEPTDDNPLVEWDKPYPGCYTRTVDGTTYNNVWSVPRKYLKSINNSEELKVGDKVMIVGTIVKDDGTDVLYRVKCSGYNSYVWVTKEAIKKIKEEK